IGFDSRATGHNHDGDFIFYDGRLNYAVLQPSVRIGPVELGYVLGLPLAGSAETGWTSGEKQYSGNAVRSVDYSNAEMRRTDGLFAAGHIPLSIFSSQALSLLIRADYVITDTLVEHGIILTTESSPMPLAEAGIRTGPAFVVRVGLEYVWPVWKP